MSSSHIKIIGWWSTQGREPSSGLTA